MEKLLYPLWKSDTLTGDAFRDALLQDLAPQLTALNCLHGLRLCVVDSAVQDAAARRIANHTPVPDALLSLWIDYAGAAASWEPLIDNYVRRKAVCLVVEAEPLVNQRQHPCAPGERVYGMCQVVFMSPPAALSQQEWLTVWKDSHTQVAIDTQSTFGYRQNLIVRQLGDERLSCHAVVEENFPPGAMADDHVFYASGGDATVLKNNMQAMMASCAKFIDFTKIDVIPMSEYLIKPLARP